MAMEPSEIFDRLASLARPKREGQLQLHEFRSLAKPLSMSPVEMDKAFSFIDSGSGDPAAISESDLGWVMNIPSLVDEDAVLLSGLLMDTETKKKYLEVSAACKGLRSIAAHSNLYGRIRGAEVPLGRIVATGDEKRMQICDS